IGIPTTLSELLMSASQMLLNNFASAHGDGFLAAIGIAWTVVMVPSMLVMGLSQGIQPLIGYTYAAKLHGRLREVLKFTLITATLFGIFMGVVIFVFGSGAVALFIKDAVVVEFGQRIVRLLVWSMPFLGVQFVLSTVFQSLGKARQTLVLSIARQGIVFIPILMLFNYTLGRDGLILAQPVSDLLSMLLTVLLFLPVRRELAGANITRENRRARLGD
ncbi:MAG: hypothetical protein LBU17_12955, partial [Treponema sp.]|nr:hypothetical protein [Treponema sp.]